MCWNSWPASDKATAPSCDAPPGQSRNCVARREVGLNSQLQDADVIQIDLIFLDLGRRAMRTKSPLLANDLCERPACLRRPSKREFLSSFHFTFRKLKLNPAKRCRLVEDDAHDLLPLVGSSPAGPFFQG